MISYLKARRAAKNARRRYELARIESLVAANQQRLNEIAAERAAGCRLCAEFEPVAR